MIEGDCCSLCGVSSDGQARDNTIAVRSRRSRARLRPTASASCGHAMWMRIQRTILLRPAWKSCGMPWLPGSSREFITPRPLVRVMRNQSF